MNIISPHQVGQMCWDKSVEANSIFHIVLAVWYKMKNLCFATYKSFILFLHYRCLCGQWIMGSTGADKVPRDSETEGSETTIEIKIKTLDSQTYTLRVDKQVNNSYAVLSWSNLSSDSV